MSDTNVLLGLLVLGLVMARQFRARPARGDGLRLLLVLGVAGLILTARAFAGVRADVGVVALLALSLLVAAACGLARGLTTRVWWADGQAWRRGGVLTGLLWLVSIGAHVGFDALLAARHAPAGLGQATILLYLAVTWGAQNMVVAARGAALAPGPAAAAAPWPEMRRYSRR